MGGRSVKVDLYNAIVSAQMSRRKMLKGSASLGAVAAMGGLGVTATAGAHGGVRAVISAKQHYVRKK